MESVVLVLASFSMWLSTSNHEGFLCQSHTANTLGTRKPWVLGGDRDMERWYLS